MSLFPPLEENKTDTNTNADIITELVMTFDQENTESIALRVTAPSVETHVASIFPNSQITPKNTENATNTQETEDIERPMSNNQSIGDFSVCSNASNQPRRNFSKLDIRLKWRYYVMCKSQALL